MKKITLKIHDMHCSSCPIMIDGKLEDEVEGVISAHTNYVQGECHVEFDENRLQPDQIVEALDGIGYTASYQE